MQTDNLSTGEGGSIKPINRQSIHRICSGQVILDVATAVKELVENSLDAGATNVEVRLREYGSALVEVADNGRGVPPADYQALTLKYHTSKITSFDDLSSVNTYGFRGEALSSLCAVSELSVVTRTAEQAAGVRLEYDHEGHLKGSTPTPRAVGTTVAIKNLFMTLPVRHKEFMRNVKREFARAVAVLQAYALIATHARVIVTHQAGKSSGRSAVFTTAAPASTYEAHAAAAATVATQGAAATPSTSHASLMPGSLTAVVASAVGSAADPRVQAQLASLRDNVVAVFGSKVAECLEPLVLPQDPETGVQVAGWVSRAGCGLRGDASRQFFFLNGRPVDLPKAARILNDSFKSLSSPAHAASCRPMAVLAVSLAAEEVDVNVTPDKRRVFMAAEDRLVSLLQQALQSLWEPSRCTYAVNQPLADTSASAVAPGSLLVSGPGHARSGVQQRQTQLPVGRASKTATVPQEAQVTSDTGGAMEHKQPADQPTSTHEVRLGDDRRDGAEGTADPSQPPPAKRPRLQPGDGDGRGVELLSHVAPDAVEPSPEAVRNPRGNGTRPRLDEPLPAGEGGAATASFRHPFLSMFGGYGAGTKGRSEGQAEAAAAEVRHSTMMDSGCDRHGAKRTAQKLSARQRPRQLTEDLDSDDEEEGATPTTRLHVPTSSHKIKLEPKDGAVDGEEARFGVLGGDVEMAEQAGFLDSPKATGGRTAVQDMSLEDNLLGNPGVDSVSEPNRPGTKATTTPNTVVKPEPVDSEGPVGIVTGSVRSELRLADVSDAGGDLGQPAPQTASLAPTAVLTLAPGQLAAATTARLRYLCAQRDQHQAAQREAGRRFMNSSLQEDGPGPGVDEPAGGLGTRAEREAAAENELERVFRKQQFREMKVIGQFNLGFILARHGPDVFIVDQHAAAEKTTFECLQRTVTLTRQRLLAPLALPPGMLMPVDQLLIREHIDVFRRNGFDFVERLPDGRLVPLPSTRSRDASRGGDGGGARDKGLQQLEQPQQEGEQQEEVEGGWVNGCEDDSRLGDRGTSWGGGGELMLSAVPVSRATGQLGMEDVAELVALLRAGEGAGSGGGGAGGQRAWEEELRPSRIRASLASRACRSSIMVGRPLRRGEMRRLLDGLAELRQPWNCPHGRPTMRHVCVLPPQPGLLPM